MVERVLMANIWRPDKAKLSDPIGTTMRPHAITMEGVERATIRPGWNPQKKNPASTAERGS
jgi:hypothetical protein